MFRYIVLIQTFNKNVLDLAESVGNVEFVEIRQTSMCGI